MEQLKRKKPCFFKQPERRGSAGAFIISVMECVMEFAGLIGGGADVLFVESGDTLVIASV